MIEFLAEQLRALGYTNPEQQAQDIYEASLIDDETEGLLNRILPRINSQLDRPYRLAPTRAGQQVLDQRAQRLAQLPTVDILSQLNDYDVPLTWIALTHQDLAYVLARLQLGLIIDPLANHLDQLTVMDRRTQLTQLVHQLNPEIKPPAEVDQLDQLIRQLVLTVPSYRVQLPPDYQQLVDAYLSPWYQSIKDQPQQVISHLAIVVPPSADLVSYLQANLSSYLPVISDRYHHPIDPVALIHHQHPELILEHYTDSFLLSVAYITYTSRYQLIDKLCSLIRQPSFFIEGNSRKLAYGTLSQYQLLSLDQLGVKVYHHGTGRLVQVELPTGDIVTGQAVNELQQLSQIISK